MQKEILDKYPEAKLRVYVIWEPMLPSDSLRRTRDDLITDKRSVHFKDSEQVSGRWFTANMKDCTSLGDAAWDAYYLYGKEAKWDERPSPTLACGTPIVQAWDELEKAIEPLLAD